MSPLHSRTPLIESKKLSDLAGRPVFLKLEALQPPGSFKIRGIGLHCTRLAEKGVEHFVSYSGGNAGLATIYAGQKLGKKVTVFVPSTIPEMMREKIRSAGGELVVIENPSEAGPAAKEFAKEPGRAFIHPFDHDDIFEGHSTLVDECIEDWKAQNVTPPDTVVVSVGGGGLLAGLLTGYEKNNWSPKTICVEPHGANSLKQSLDKGSVVTLDRVDTRVTSLAGMTTAPKVLEYSKKFKLEPHLLSDEVAMVSAARFADDHRIMVEPACGAALSLVYQTPEALNGARSVLIVGCGGAGVTTDLLKEWKHILD